MHDISKTVFSHPLALQQLQETTNILYTCTNFFVICYFSLLTRSIICLKWSPESTNIKMESYLSHFDFLAFYQIHTRRTSHVLLCGRSKKLPHYSIQITKCTNAKWSYPPLLFYQSQWIKFLAFILAYWTDFGTSFPRHWMFYLNIQFEYLLLFYYSISKKKTFLLLIEYQLQMLSIDIWLNEETGATNAFMIHYQRFFLMKK